MAKDVVRVNFVLDKNVYIQLLKLQKYYTRLENKKNTLTDVVKFLIVQEYQNEFDNVNSLELDYNI